MLLLALTAYKSTVVPLRHEFTIEHYHWLADVMPGNTCSHVLVQFAVCIAMPILHAFGSCLFFSPHFIGAVVL